MSVRVHSKPPSSAASLPAPPSFSKTILLLALSIFRGVGAAGTASGLSHQISPLQLGNSPLSGKRALGPEFTVNSNVSGDQYFSNTEGLDNGGFVTVFESTDPGPFLDTFAQLFDSSGNPQGTSFKVPTNSSANNIGNSVSSLSGKFTVGWSRNSGAPSTSDAFFQIFSNNGTKNGVETKANTAILGSQFISVNSIKAGGFAYVGSVKSPEPYLQGQYFNDQGISAGNFNPTGSAKPSGRGFSNGDFAICALYSVGTDSLALSLTTPFGQPYRSESVYGYLEPSNCKIAEIANKRFVAVFDSYGSNGIDSDVYLQEYLLTGQTNETVEVVNTETAGAQGSPSICSHPGGSLVVYECIDKMGSGFFNVCAQDLDDSLQKSGVEFQINSDPTRITTADTVRPSCALFANGTTIAVTWTSAATGLIGRDVRGRILTVSNLGNFTTSTRGLTTSGVSSLPQTTTTSVRAMSTGSLASTALTPSSGTTLGTNSVQSSSVSTFSTNSYQSSTSSTMTGLSQSSTALSTPRGVQTTTTSFGVNTSSAESNPAAPANSPSSQTPLIAGVASAVSAVALLILLGIFLRCRKKRGTRAPDVNEMELANQPSRYQSFHNDPPGKVSSTYQTLQISARSAEYDVPNMEQAPNSIEGTPYAGGASGDHAKVPPRQYGVVLPPGNYHVNEIPNQERAAASSTGTYSGAEFKQSYAGVNEQVALPPISYTGLPQNRGSEKAGQTKVTYEQPSDALIP